MSFSCNIPKNKVNMQYVEEILNSKSEANINLGRWKWDIFDSGNYSYGILGGSALSDRSIQVEEG